MLITRKSVLTGVTRTLDLPVTEQQLAAWQSGALIQGAMPNLDSNQREFIISGCTQEEWDEYFTEH